MVHRKAGEINWSDWYIHLNLSWIHKIVNGFPDLGSKIMVSTALILVLLKIEENQTASTLIA